MLTLFAQKSPHALQSDLGPEGPLRIIGVDFELVPQCVQLYIDNHKIQEIVKHQKACVKTQI